MKMSWPHSSFRGLLGAGAKSFRRLRNQFPPPQWKEQERDAGCYSHINQGPFDMTTVSGTPYISTLAPISGLSHLGNLVLFSFD